MNEHVIWNELGILHSNAGAYPQAIQAFRQAVDLNDQFTAAMQNLAHAYTETGALLQAVEVYLGCIESTADSKEKAALWNQLGNLYMQMDNAREAQNAYQEAESLRTAEKDLPPSLMDPGLASASETPAQPAQTGFAQLKLEQILLNPRQPRLRISVHDLVESVREHGIIQPLIVSPNGDNEHYILVSGERRLEAARQVGLDTVPAIIRQVTEQERLELALIENVQRLSLSPLEQAEAYTQLRDEYDLSPEEIARRMGKSSVAVRNMLRQLELPEKIRRALDAGRISAGHARALLGLETPTQQLQVLEQVLTHDLTIRKTEALVRALTSGVNERQNNGSKPQVESVAHDAPAADISPPVAEVEEEANDDPHPPVEEVVEDQKAALFYLDESDVLPASLPDADEPVRDEDHAEEVSEPIELTDEADALEEELSLPQTANFEDGEASYSEEEVRNRIITFKSVTAQNPQNDRAWSRLAKHYELINENENAIEAYQRALALVPDNSDYHYRLGLVYSTEGLYEDAVESLKVALAFDENESIVHCALASNYRRMEMHTEADEHIAAVAPLMERDTAYNQACFESIRGNTVKAVELLQSALHLKEATVEKIQNDPDFDFIRHDDLFMELLDEVSGKTLTVSS